MYVTGCRSGAFMGVAAYIPTDGEVDHGGVMDVAAVGGRRSAPNRIADPISADIARGVPHTQLECVGRPMDVFALALQDNPFSVPTDPHAKFQRLVRTDLLGNLSREGGPVSNGT